MSTRSGREAGDALPLAVRFPALARVPRLPLGRFPTPVERLDAVAPSLWIKRDDRSANPIGGNKVRALEFLLAGLRAGDRVVTVGSAGSTHALSVATYASRAGARVLVGRWRQEMNETAERVARAIDGLAERAPVFASPVGAYLWASGQRLRGARWIAAGGTTPLGILGHVNAALELAAQIDAGLAPRPDAVVLPLGTGGTMAGLALGFAIASMRVRVIGARVVPALVARRGRVLSLARRTARLIERLAGVQVPRIGPTSIEIAGEGYGGAYGRETAAGRDAARRLREASGIVLDATYSAKASAVALDRAARNARETVLFWLTFDARTLGDDTS